MQDPIGLSIAGERLRFFSSQRLLASDLENLEASGRELRWLHNRSLHQPGVASGFAITGEKGAREVIVGPGYAIDAFGREIVLTETRTIAVPPVAAGADGKAAAFDLAATYPGDDLDTTETRRSFCGGPEAVRQREVPSFQWVDVLRPSDLLRELLSAQRIALGRVEVLNCKLASRVSLERRREAKPSAYPFIAAGSTGVEAWTYPAAPTAFGIELTAEVDAGAAGFHGAPHYLVSVVGDRRIDIDGASFLLDGFASVSKAKATGFTLSVLLPTMLIAASGAGAAEILGRIRGRLPWRIEWVGVEN